MADKAGRLVRILRSPRLTIVLMALAMVLVFAGTLAQTEQGIWSVVHRYFRCIVAWIDLPLFFPRGWPVPPLKVPFPGGFLIGGLLVANLLAVHFTHFRIRASGRRRIAGFALLLLGFMVVLGTLLGWGTPPLAASHGDAFWRVFFRLGRGSVAALVLYAACRLLYRERAGLVLLHGGILFLLVGEFATALHATEGSMTIREGETVNYVDHARQQELAIVDTSNPAFDTTTAIPADRLRDGAILRPKALPFDIRVVRHMPNSSQPRPIAGLPGGAPPDYPRYAGPGSRLYVAERPEVSDPRMRNAPAIDVELVERATGAPIGRYILPIWFYPNFVAKSWDIPTRVRVDGRNYTLYLRFRREYLRTPAGHPYAIQLLDFVHENYEGTDIPKTFSSQIRLINSDENTDRKLCIRMNNPLRYARRTFYQSGFLPNDSGTVLQVVRNDGWMVPYLACMIVSVGMAAQMLHSLRHYLRAL